MSPRGWVRTGLCRIRCPLPSPCGRGDALWSARGNASTGGDTAAVAAEHPRCWQAARGSILGTAPQLGAGTRAVGPASRRWDHAATGRGLATAAALLCLLCNFGCGWSLLRGQADWVVFLCFTISYVVL